MSGLNELPLSGRKVIRYYVVIAITNSICDLGNFIWLLVYIIVSQEKAGSWDAKYVPLINHWGNLLKVFVELTGVTLKGLIYILYRAALPSKPHFTTPQQLSWACSLLASTVNPQGGLCVDGSGSPRSQITGSLQARRIVETVQHDTLQTAPASVTEHTDIDRCLPSATQERQEEEGHH